VFEQNIFLASNCPKLISLTKMNHIERKIIAFQHKKYTNPQYNHQNNHRKAPL